MYSSIEGTEYPVLGGRCYGDSLILGGRFRDLVNHHGFDGQLARLQFQAESFDRVEDRASWDVGILPGLYLDLVLSVQTGLSITGALANRTSWAAKSSIVIESHDRALNGPTSASLSCICFILAPMPA